MYFCGQKCVKKGWPAHRDFCKRHRDICARLEKLVSLLFVDGNPVDEIFLDAFKTFVAERVLKMSRVGERKPIVETLQVFYEVGGVNAVGMLKSFVPVMENEDYLGSWLASQVMDKDYPPLPGVPSDDAAGMVEMIGMILEGYLNDKELARARSADEEQLGGTPGEKPETGE